MTDIVRDHLCGIIPLTVTLKEAVRGIVAFLGAALVDGVTALVCVGCGEEDAALGVIAFVGAALVDGVTPLVCVGCGEEGSTLGNHEEKRGCKNTVRLTNCGDLPVGTACDTPGNPCGRIW